MRMQVILDSSFARPGSAPIWGGKKGEFRDWTKRHHEKNLYVSPVVLNKMTCAVSKKLQGFRRVLCKSLLSKFRQCEDYFEQPKPYLEPLTFVWQRCLLQCEYFDFVCLLFHYN